MLNHESAHPEYFEELCALAASGQISEWEFVELQDHVQGCPDCRSRYEEFIDLLHNKLPLVDPELRGSSKVAGLFSENSSYRERFLTRARRQGLVISQGSLRNSFSSKLRFWHEQRLRALLREVISDDPDVEVDRVSNEEQRRYDLGYQVTGFTLHQALALRSLCRPQFHFEIAGREGTTPKLLVVSYQQIGPCREVGYTIPLPRDLRDGEFRHRGRLWLDVTTAQLWREERELWVRPKAGGQEFRLIRSEYEYAPSNFDLLLPRRIRMDISDHARRVRGRTAYLDLGGRITMSYGAFSRFDVSTSWKAADVEATTAKR